MYRITMLLIGVYTIASADSFGPDDLKSKVPPPVVEIFKLAGHFEKYDITFHLNPFYLRGDFDGDRRYDLAIMVQRKADRKIGIAFYNPVNDQITIVGAGGALRGGADIDDLSWVNYWYAKPKEELKRSMVDPALPQPAGEVIMLHLWEVSSAAIYFDAAKREYRMYWQAD